MTLYETTAVVTFGPGQMLTLDADQVRRRRHNLLVGKTKAKRVEVETRRHVQFKAGEVVGLDGDLPGALAAVMIVVGGEAPKPKPAPPPKAPPSWLSRWRGKFASESDPAPDPAPAPDLSALALDPPADDLASGDAR